MQLKVYRAAGALDRVPHLQGEAARFVFAQPADPVEVLRVGLAAAGGPVALACSFSLEDVLIIDLAAAHSLPIEVFALDTGRLPEETFEVAAALRERYPIAINWYAPEARAVEQLLQLKGPLSFRESLKERHECCGLRKVEPLQRALQGKAGWITGQRRAYGVTRSELGAIEIDHAHGGILKLNPLCDLSDEQVAARGLPKSRLYERGYASIGCAPCTRPVAPGEDPRSGRWWWESPEHKECGLHRRPG